MRRCCEEAYPAEACGVLLGNKVAEECAVATVIPCRNVASDPSRRYCIDPVELIRVQRQARERGLEVVGFYHSHPDHAARPSQTDIEDAHWIGYSYVITRVGRGKATETRSFLLSGTAEENKEFVEEPITFGA
jgi:proteasome lid subunit RPN8/RPN11